MRISKWSMSAKPGLVVSMFFAVMLTGCDLSFMGDEIGSGGTNSDDGGGNQDGSGEIMQVTVNGDVGVSGVTNSFIIVTTTNGSTAWSGSSDSKSDYAATMSLAQRDFPLTSRASGGSDIVSGFGPDFEMRSTVMNPSTTVGNINLYSTIITMTANEQGRGVNDSSIAVATQVTLEKLNFGFDTARIPNPITSPVVNSNVANCYRSNVALSEMISRTSSALLIAGFAFSSDQVIAHLSGDLTDGVIDGRGINSNAHVAATSSIVSAQILLETMANDLRVGGFDAEDRINMAISMTHPGATILTGDLTAPAEMISQAALTLAAAYDLSPDAELAELFDAVAVTPTGATVLTSRQLLPSGFSETIDASIAKIATGTASDDEVVNARMRTGLDPNAVDRTPPVISLIGASTIPLSVGDAYLEQGANATDDRDGDLTTLVVIDNQSVDTSVANDYIVTYNVSDFSGNAATQVTRTVSVSTPESVDTVPPVITIKGDNPMNLVQGDRYRGLGATAIDNVDGDISSRIKVNNSAVNTSAVGNYAVTYNVTDAAGNAAVEAVRMVIVSAPQSVDTVPPVITILGANPMNLIQGDTYRGLGALAIDDVDGDISDNVVVNNSAVNTSVVGNYAVTYNVSDAAGNAAAEAVRTVIVSAPSQTGDTVRPVITLVGADPLTLTVGNTYIEPGATATDNVDGNITARISINSSNVNTNSAGTYTVTYNVSDNAGNAAIQVTRSVIVRAAPGGSGGRPWESVLSEMVGYAAHFGVTGGAGKQVLTVTNLNNSGSGSLRQAIADAGSGAWIRFRSGLTGRIRLGSALGMVRNITIDGRGADITIQGPGGSGSTINANRGDQNWILMYLKLDGPVGGNNDLLQVMNTTSANPFATDNAERFWVYHLSFTNAEDETASFIRTEGKYTVQSSYFGNNTAGNTGYCALISHGTQGNYGWEKVIHKATWTRNYWDRCKDRIPYITIPSNIHIFNNYYYDWAATSIHVTARFGATLPAQLLFENNVATAGRHNQLVKPTLSNAIDGDARLDGNMFTNGAFGAERNRSKVFAAPYPYTSITATTAFRNAVMAEAGWQNVPFPE